MKYPFVFVLLYIGWLALQSCPCLDPHHSLQRKQYSCCFWLNYQKNQPIRIGICLLWFNHNTGLQSYLCLWAFWLKYSLLVIKALAKSSPAMSTEANHQAVSVFKLVYQELGNSCWDILAVRNSTCRTGTAGCCFMQWPQSAMHTGSRGITCSCKAHHTKGGQLGSDFIIFALCKSL